jgi:hypothetical protein
LRTILHKFFALVTLLIPFAIRAQTHGSGLLDDSAGREMMRQAEEMILAYHKDAPKTHHVLRVVYFVPKDTEPLRDYAERLDRVMTDVSDFYRDGFTRLGTQTDGLPLERKDGKLVVRVVRGELAAGEYHFDNGERPASEIRRALAGSIDMDREHVLVFYPCKKAEGGRYIFDVPYYGAAGSTQKNGLCHAADCELLDPALLRETNRPMVFTEHYYPLFKTTVAEFNSMYLGGGAHELGHALGLPHENGTEFEQRFGISLMGAGNLTYREELWSAQQPSYLGLATVLQLASHPFFTGSDRGRWDDPHGDFNSLQFSTSNGDIEIHGIATGDILPYAVVAYLWSGDDHYCTAFPSVCNDGAFKIDLGKLPSTESHLGKIPGGARGFKMARGKADAEKMRHWHLDLARFYVNGATERQAFSFDGDAASPPDVAVLNGQWVVSRAEDAVMHGRGDAKKCVDDAAIASAPTQDAARKLRLLHAVLEPPGPFDLRAVRDSSAFLSDAAWTDARVGWGHVARNHYWFDEHIRNGVFLQLGGKFYDKGLYAHSDSRYIFPLDGKWKTFTATVGIRDGANPQGSAIFKVVGDGKELYCSHMLRVDQHEDIHVNVSGVKKIELLARGGEGHNHNSWAIWAEPKVER